LLRQTNRIIDLNIIYKQLCAIGEFGIVKHEDFL
jgi:hypothetical protein